MDALLLRTAHPLDPAWLAHEPPITFPHQNESLTPLQRQETYATWCRALTARQTAPDARDHHLLSDVVKTELSVPSTDDHPVPVIKYTRAAQAEDKNPDTDGLKETLILYLHGGGLHVGAPDSEELSILRIISHLPHTTVLSAGYRLLPVYSAQTAVSDSAAVFEFLLRLRETEMPRARVVVMGSSSGGELAALVAQEAAPGMIDGVVLRGPVTSDAFSGKEYVPERLRSLHTSAWEGSFYTRLLGVMRRAVARDGLERMPLEAGEEVLRRHPKTWIQVCTNDSLYSDGVCYAKALEEAGVEVRVDVVEGWPHTFWLIAPELDRALQAEEAMLEGLSWVLENKQDAAKV